MQAVSHHVRMSSLHFMLNPEMPRFTKQILFSRIMISAILLFGSNGLPALGFGLTPERLVESSELIVVGTVQSIESWWVVRESGNRVYPNLHIDGSEIQTFFQFDIERILKGDATANTIEFFCSGGRIGSRVQGASYTAALSFNERDRVVLFLRTYEMQWSPVGGTRGAFLVVNLDDGSDMLRPIDSDDKPTVPHEMANDINVPLRNVLSIRDIEDIIARQAQ